VFTASACTLPRATIVCGRWGFRCGLGDMRSVCLVGVKGRIQKVGGTPSVSARQTWHSVRRDAASDAENDDKFETLGQGPPDTLPGTSRTIYIFRVNDVS
ncbi:hypothetical protein BaRGS_00001889, partial [Batillaria attramentaria]